MLEPTHRRWLNGATPTKNSALASAVAELPPVSGVQLLGKFDGLANRPQIYAGTANRAIRRLVPDKPRCAAQQS